MTDTIRARGSIGPFRGGTAYFEPQAYLLTASRAEIHGTRTRNINDPFDNQVEFNSGSIRIYDLSPVEVKVRPGHFDVGWSGRALFSSKPLGAFEDFAIYTDRDPVQGFIESDNSGALSGAVGQDWTRHQRILYPPKGTQFVVPHVRLGDVPAGSVQYLDAFQTEVLPLNQSDVTDYQSPRSLSVIVRPDRINLSENPNGDYDSEAWFNVTRGDGGLYAEGKALHYVRGLKPGEWYVKSAYVDSGSKVTLDGQENIAEQAGLIRRIWVLFQAEEEWASMDFDSPGRYRIYGAMVEPGRTIQPYFDGDSGEDYLWEFGKPQGAGKSYFYNQRNQRHYILRRTLQENVPIGISVLDPIYGQGTDVSKSYGFGTGAYGLTTYGE